MNANKLQTTNFKEQKQQQQQQNNDNNRMKTTILNRTKPDHIYSNGFKSGGGLFTSSSKGSF